MYTHTHTHTYCCHYILLLFIFTMLYVSNLTKFGEERACSRNAKCWSPADYRLSRSLFLTLRRLLIVLKYGVFLPRRKCQVTWLIQAHQYWLRRIINHDVRMHIRVNGSRCGFYISHVKCNVRHGSRDVRTSLPTVPTYPLQNLHAKLCGHWRRRRKRCRERMQWRWWGRRTGKRIQKIQGKCDKEG